MNRLIFMELKKNCKNALLIPTSMGVRLNPIDRQPLNTADTFKAVVSSAESNVATPIAYLGLPVKALTAVVKGSPISQLIWNDLAKRHIQVEAAMFDQGGPWGYRHQINYADCGYGARGPEVFNDRAGEVGRMMDASQFDLERIFVDEGVQLLHISGLFAALSPQSARFCLKLIELAKANGTRISFDVNYRASFWQHREGELSKVFKEIASNADILFVGYGPDLPIALGVECVDYESETLFEDFEPFKEMVARIRAAYPNAQWISTTMRKVIDANSHLWGAMLSAGNDFHIAEPRPISVLDRIGGGDGYAAGKLYGLLRGWSPEKCMRFGWANGAFAVSVFTDYTLPSSEEQLWQIWHGNALIKR